MSLLKSDADFIRANVHLLSEQKAYKFYKLYAKDYGCIPTDVTQVLIDSIGAQRLLTSFNNVIPDYVFADTTGLSNIVIPGTVRMIQTEAFIRTDVEGVKIMQGVCSLFDNAFNSCIKLEDVHLPNTIEYIGEGVFEDCLQLSAIFYNGTYDEWKKIEKKSGWKNKPVTIYSKSGVFDE